MDRNEQSPSPPRFFFLDNVRYFVIMFVILQHVALIYSGYAQGHSFSQFLFSRIVNITDVFMIPLMFFIAGFFALPSIRKQGTARFLQGKVMRIWLPWLIGVTLVVPIATYCMYSMRTVSGGAIPSGYWHYWVSLMRDAARFHTGFVTSPDQFSHKHLWFLSVLFFFFVLFSALYTAAGLVPGFASKRGTGKVESGAGMTRALLVLGALSAAGFFTVKLFFRWGYQATLILGLIHFDPSRLAVFIVYFFFGVYASSRMWFSGGAVLRGLPVWIPVFLISFFAFEYLSFSESITLTLGMKFIITVLRSVLCLSMFVVILSVSHRVWNSSSPLNRLLASNSYTVYIIHYPLHAAAAVVLVPFGVHILVKFAAVFLFSVVTSYALGEYCVKPFPRLSVAGIALINIILFALVR